MRPRLDRPDLHRRAPPKGAVLPMLLGCLLLLVLPMQVRAERHALLVGVGDYRDGGPGIDLEGPAYDVAALRKVLVERWGFAAAHVHSLVDERATRARILSELKDLVQRTTPGDQVVIYFSGHGTSLYDPGHKLPLPDNSGAQLPWDFPLHGDAEAQLASLIIGRRDLLPVLHRLDRGGRMATVFIDSCYSGNAVRGLYRSLLPVADGPPALPSRTLSWLLSARPSARALGGRGEAEIQSLMGCFDCGHVRADAPYPYANVVFLGASSDKEQAKDIRRQDLKWYPSIDGQPHGAFTDALLRVLEGQLPADRDGRNGIEVGELRDAVSAFIQRRGYPQTPQLLPTLDQDVNSLASRRLFGAAPNPLTGHGESAPVLDGEGEGEEGAGDRTRGMGVRLQGKLSETQRQAVLGVAGIVEVDREPDLVVAAEGGKVRLLTPALDLIAELPASAVDRLTALVRQRRWVWTLLAEHGPDAGFNLHLDLVDGLQGSSLGKGSLVYFTVKAERRVWVLLLDVMPDGRIVPLYPANQRELAPLPAQRAVRLPDPSRYAIRVVEPFGTDQVIALGFLSAHPFLKNVIGRKTLGDALKAELEALLRNPETPLARAEVVLHTVPRQNKHPVWQPSP